ANSERRRGYCAMRLEVLANGTPAGQRGPIFLAVLVAWTTVATLPAFAQTPKPAESKETPNAATAKGAEQAKPGRANLLRGQYGPYRANNDLLYYHLDVRVDPEKKTISGKNLIRFRMLKDDTKIQLDLQPALAVEKVLMGNNPLKFEREFGAV